MKKILAFLLVFVMVFALAACNDNSTDTSSTEPSSTAVSTPAQSDVDESSEAPAESSEQPSEEPSDEPSSEEPSDEPSEAPSEPEPSLPEYLDAFVFVNGQVYAMAPTDAYSIRITKMNDIAESGDVACFTPDFGNSIYVNGEDYADYAILVVEYNMEKYMYLKKEIIPLDSDVDKSNIAIPEDGFVIAIHKDQKKMLSVLDLVSDDVEIYPSNFNPYITEYDVHRVDTPFDIDGVVGDEWEDYLIDEINETNPAWDYRQFDLTKESPITADYYMAYDDNGVYFAVVVNAENCVWMPGISPDNLSGMWAYTCIQVNTIDQTPLSDYMLKHAQYGFDTLAVTEDHVRQYGFSGSEGGDSYGVVYFGGTHAQIDSNAKYSCIFDKANEIITYEVYLPFTEINIDPEEVKPGFEFSISVSINSSVDTTAWKNIRMRNGGGIIGMNEFSKMPVCIIK